MPGAGRDTAAGHPQRRVRLLQFTGLGLALAIWWYDTRAADLGVIGARGLLEVVGPGYWVSLALLSTVGASALVRRRLDHVVLTATAAAGTLMVYLYVSVATGVAGFGTVWVHVGFIDHIVQHHALADGVDARFSWPGFFATGAAIVRSAHLSDAGALALLAPLWVNVSALPALLVIGRFVTGGIRTAWLGCFVYLLFNWFSQDYFAPQATALLLYLALLAVLVHQLQVSPLPGLTGPWWRRARQAVHRVPGRPPGVGAGGMLWREALLVLLIGGIVITHQLTPVVVIAVTFVFACTGTTRHRTLAVLTGVLFLGWFAWGATDFWTGNLRNVVQDIGQLGGNVNRGLAGRLGASDPGYDAMQRLRILWSAAYLMLGPLGGLVVLRRGHHPVLVGGLVLTPFALVGVQSYGGEVIFRSFVLAAPVLAPLGALGLSAVGGGLARAVRRGRPVTGWTAPRRVGAAVLVAGLGLAAGAALTTTRGLNAGFERITATEMAGAQAMLAQAPKGATVAVLNPLGPAMRSRATELTGVGLRVSSCSNPEPLWAELIATPAAWPDPVQCLMTDPPDYIYVTQGQITMDTLRSGLQQDWAWSLVDRLAANPDYTVLYRAADTVVLKRSTPAPGSAGADGPARTDG